MHEFDTYTTTLRPAPRDASGQTVVISMLFLTALLLMAGIVIDGGTYLLQRRNLQGNSDSAALAAVKQLPDSTSLATSDANSYSGSKNTSDQASVSSVEFSNSNTTVKVTVHRSVSGYLMNMFGIGPPDINATATARVNQVSGVAGGLLPIGVLRGGYTLGSANDFHDPSGAPGNWGNLAPNYGPPDCPYTPSGASGLKDEIAGPFGGGTNGCGPDVGGTIDTQTGNTNSMQQGFNLRFGFSASDNNPDWGSVSDTWSNTLHYDSAAGKYIIDRPNSPRLGFIPVLTATDGSLTWPSGNGEMLVVGYIMVFIGKVGTSGEPPYTGNGHSMDVWITPIDAIMPDSMSSVSDKSLSSSWDSSSGNQDSPLVYRLVE